MSLFVSLFLIAFTSSAQKSTGKYPLTFPRDEQKVILRQISQIIFQNETNCKKENLISWNEGEDFPSLGLGHAIWFPQDVKPGYQEAFPELLQFIKLRLKKQKTLLLPALLSKNPLGPAPWKNRAEFLSVEKATEKLELQNFLAHPQVMEWQTEFMIERMKLSLYKILTATENQGSTGPSRARRMHVQIQRLLRSEVGFLSLIDYVNFKGEGLRPTEVTPLGQYPWGLKVVLEKMAELKPHTVVCDKKDLRHYDADKCANYAFAEAALWSLTRLANNWGVEGTDHHALRATWLQGGWSRRVRETYLPGSIERNTCKI